MKAVLILFVVVAFAAGSAFAETCPTCGGDLTDKGRCPWCQPKPEADQ